MENPQISNMGELNLSLPASLLDGIRKGNLVPFVGSGASLAIQPGLFPTWRQVLERMRDKLNAESKPKNAQIVELFLSDNRLLDAARESTA